MLTGIVCETLLSGLPLSSGVDGELKCIPRLTIALFVSSDCAASGLDSKCLSVFEQALLV
jgi:hypothetical protein